MINKLKKHPLYSIILYDVLIKRILKILTDWQFIVFEYIFYMKKIPNLKNPQLFSEKIQWIKIYGNLEEYTKFVDKYEVRKYIAERIGSGYLIPLLGVWNKVEDIDFDLLPNQFVLKATHGQGYNLICKDKEKLDIAATKTKLNKWVKENFYQKTRERQYKNCIPRIICEKYLEDETGELSDYKIQCFNGEPYLIEVVTDRSKGYKYDPMYLNWTKAPITAKGYVDSGKLLKRPNNLNKLIETAKMLAKPFPYVRVDLYSVADSVYFGELTFTPGSGLDKYEPESEDLKLGSMIDLSKLGKQNKIN